MEFGKCWEAVVENVRDGLLVVGLDGRIMAANPAMETIVGFTAEELVGQICTVLNCTGCYIYEDHEKNPWCKLFTVGYVKDKQCHLTHKNGRTIQALKSGKALHDNNGTLIGVVETISDVTELVTQKDEIRLLKKQLFHDLGYYGILGESDPMKKMFELIESVAPSEVPVLIEGQSGTGKELAARAIHEASDRKNKPFIKVNCAALNENLLESELFGHVKGAFTGADKERVGRFEAAHGGTIFLDEIGDIPLSTQVKLLRVLEEREIEKVGDNKPVPIDVRIVSATNKDLQEMIRAKLFREDFFFRINVFPVLCPPLSERKTDIPLLINQFIRQNARGQRRQIQGVTHKVMESFMAYHWPGNVRELRNVIEYALVLCSGELIGTKHLPASITIVNPTKKVRPDKRTFDTIEKEELIDALKSTGNNKSEAARLLGVSRVTVWKRMKKYGLVCPL